MTKPKSPAHAPWMPADWENADASAIQALARGVANEGQQKRALDYIINVLGMTYQHTFIPGLDGSRLSDFASGRRYVGLQIVKLIKLPAHELKKPKEGNNG